MYSWELARCSGGLGSHSARRSLARLGIWAHSANELTRLYRNVPLEPSSAYLP